MAKESRLNKMVCAGVICAVGAVASAREDVGRAIEALMKGGLDCFELMRDVPERYALLGELKKNHPEAILGIGTVLDTECAQAAVAAGAEFLVSPGLSLDLIRFCERYGVVSCFGALTPTEILYAREAGLDLVKVFPTNAMGGSEYIRTLSDPFPHVRLVGAGGVTLENAPDYFRAGAALVAVDADLIAPDLVDRRDWQALTERAIQYRSMLDRCQSTRANKA